MSRVKAGEAYVEIGGDPRKLFAALGKVNRQIGKIGSSMASAGTKMAAVGGAIVAPILGAAQAFASVGSALDDMSKRTGVAAESLSVLKFAAEQTGTDMAGVETAVKKMQKAIYAAGHGSKEAASALEMVGLSASDLAGLSADQQMGKIADGLMAIEDPGTRAAVAMQIFGKAGTMILPMLEGGSAGMAAFAAEAKRLGLVMDSETAAKADSLGDAIDALKASMQMAFIQIGSAVAPILTKIAQALATGAAAVGKFIRENEQFVVSVLKWGTAFTAAGGGLIALGKTISFASGALALLGSVASATLAPLRLLFAAGTGIGGAFASAVPGVFKLANSFGQAIVAAASYISSLATMAAATAARMGFVAATWAATGIAIAAGFLAHMKAMITYYTGALAGMQAITIARTGAMAAAWLASLGGVDTFGNALKSTLSMSNRVVASTVATIGPAIGFISKGFAALASDVARLAAPLTQPFVRAAGAVSTFATGVATSVASYISSIASAAAATVTNNAKIAAAWVGSALKAVGTFVAGVAGSVATYIGSIAGAVAATVGAAAGIAGAWLATAFPATAAFVSQAVASLATYIASTASALAASVASAAGVAVAWVSSGMPGLLAFVGGAVAGIATYLGSCAAAVAGSVASAAAVAAAWLAPVAPILAIGGVLVGAVGVAYQFGGQLKGALSGVGELAGQAGAAIGSSFSTAVADATIVFGDLYKTGKETFSGIYDAVANGDLSGAMDILWAGLQAGWLRGVEALMGYVDPWISMFQNAFTILGAEIYKVWDTIWVNVSNSFNTFGAYLFGAFDNVINTVMASWDTLEAGIRKSWNYVQSFFRRGFNLKKENEKVDSEMAAKARKRELERPGIEGRAKKAAAENEKALRERDQNAKAVDANTEATIAAREAQNSKNAKDRSAATQAAKDRLSELTTGQRDKREAQMRAGELTDSLGSKDTQFGVQKVAEEFWALAAAGKLTEEQITKFRDAVEAAQDRIETARGEAGVGAAESRPVDPEAIRKAAAEAAASQSEVAGAFSAQAVGGMGFGQTLQQKANELLGKIEQNTRQDNADLVAA